VAIRKLNEFETNALDQALKQGSTIEQLTAQYGAEALAKAQQETGVKLPGSGAVKITDAERKLYIDTVSGGRDIVDVLGKTGISASDALSRLQEAQLYVPLTQSHQQAFDWAKGNKVSAPQLAELANAPLGEIETRLTAAGLTLPKTKNTGTITQLPGSDSNYPGGLPREQEAGGMYGLSKEGISLNPAMIGVRRQAKRRADPNWRGQTDTILTGGQGVLGDANTQIKTLLGA
jgi:hypothetical protein